MGQAIRLYLFFTLFFTTATVHAQGILGCFGCGYFDCNPRECPPSTSRPPVGTGDEHLAEFSINTNAVSQGGIPILTVDRYLVASVYNNPNEATMDVRIQGTDNLPSHTDVSSIAFQFGRADPIRVANPDVHAGNTVGFPVSAEAVFWAVRGTGNPVSMLPMS